LMKADPWDANVPSYVGGLEEVRRHMRTVVSRDAERTNWGVGYATLRTYSDCM